MPGVLVAIDWENVRRGFADFVEWVTPEQVCKAFKEVASRFGDWRGGTVFGDWTLRPQEARVFEDNGLQAYNVLRSRAGKDRSDSAIMLEVYDLVRDKPDIGTFILGSGDSDFKELIRRARARGKAVVICAFGNSIAGELKTMTPIFPLEVELGLTPKTISAPPPGIATAVGVSKWTTFVNRLDGLERKLPYIVRSYLVHTLLSNAWGCGDSEPEKDEFVREAETAGIIELYETGNPKQAGRKVVAIRLARTNKTVVQILGS